MQSPCPDTTVIATFETVGRSLPPAPANPIDYDEPDDDYYEPAPSVRPTVSPARQRRMSAALAAVERDLKEMADKHERIRRYGWLSTRKRMGLL